MATPVLDEQTIATFADYQRTQQVLEGLVQTVGFMNFPVKENGERVMRETEVAVFRLEGGVKAYCPKNEFREHDFSSLNGFVGTIQNLIIDELDLEHGMAIVSVRKADLQEKENFWSQLEYLEKKGILQDEVFQGTVQGVNFKSGHIHVRVKGQDCFMNRNDWSWDRSTDLRTEVDRGADVEVMVRRFDKENGLVQVSRKDTMTDPFKVLEGMKEMELVVGRVVRIDPVHGIFVRVEEGVTLKATKPRSLEEPLTGEIVSCRIRELNPQKREGKVVIVNYPRGKKKARDLGDFLYE